MTTSAQAQNLESRGRADEGHFTLPQRILLWVVSLVGFLAIRLIGPTLRWSVSFEAGGPNSDRIQPAILVFWHRCVFAATWWFRRRDIQVMTSRSFDGEYIARIIEKFGYGAVRGSSSRGAVRALLGMHTEIEQGKAVAFTIDGPRGPLYVAKPGPVLLARNTGAPLICFYIAMENPWVLDTWDKFMIPKPFSRAHLRLGKVISVPRRADSATLEQFHREMQATLDRIREKAEADFAAD